MRYSVWVALAVALAGAPAAAQSYYFSPDVPTDLGGVTYLPWQIVRSDSGVYSPVLTLPEFTAVDALQAMDAGDWLISVESPTELPPGSGTFFRSEDVIRTDGVSYSAFFCGGTVGVPAGSNVDAAVLLGGDAGTLALSFDVPTDLTGLGGLIVEPSDLVKFLSTGPNCDDWSYDGLHFDGSASTPVVPASDNVTGSSVLGSLTLLGFDVPTTLGSTFVPGEVVQWDGAGFGTHAFDGNWPLSSRIDALSCLANPGLVPATLTVAKSTITSGDLTLTWQESCSVGGEDYGIYEGTIAALHAGAYDHAQIDCTDDGGDLTEEVSPGGVDRYYLVVPNHAQAEGSYGLDFDGGSSSNERPVGTTVCRSIQQISPCP